jgi:hypothetical protein
MKTLHCLIAGLRPTCLSVANRISIPLLLVGASLGLVQPCAGLSVEFRETGSLMTARANHTATLLSNGKVLAAAGYNISSGHLASGTL